jgi:hypothetical protein
VYERLFVHMFVKPHLLVLIFFKRRRVRGKVIPMAIESRGMLKNLSNPHFFLKKGEIECLPFSRGKKE